MLGDTIQTYLEIIREFAKSHPAAAGIVIGGVAVCAGVALVATYGVDLNSSTPAMLKLIGLGFLVAVLGYIVTHKVLIPIVASCLVVFGIAYGVVYLLSLTMPQNESLACLVAFDCRQEADQRAAAQPGADEPILEPQLLPMSVPPFTDIFGPNTSTFPRPQIVSKDPSPPESAFANLGQLVYVQFAGAISRDAVRAFMVQLRAAGWNVQGVEGGGERILAADGLAEVRYARESSSDAAAAEALVAFINASKVIERTFKAEPNGVVAPGTLEIWMGR